MKGQIILAIDQGTTNTKALLVDEAGAVVRRASRPVKVDYPQPAWVEQDPLELWSTTQETIDELIQGYSGANETVAAVAVTNQRESVLIWDRKTGKPAGPCIVWQCRRTAPFCSQLRERGLEPRITQLTGLTIDPLFSASKARWLLDYIPDGRARAENGELCLGTVDSWILWNLTGGAVHACDASNAARTQLLNIHTAAWDPELLSMFDIPASLLPEVKPSSAVYGLTAASSCLPAGIPVASLIGDSHAALFGHAGFEPGMVKATYGTGSSLMTPTRTPIFSKHGISTTIAYARQQVYYALEGNILATGAGVQWLGQLFSLADSGAGVEELAARVEDTGGVYLVPAFVGLGAPFWKDQARGLITGLTRGSAGCI
jgi:glycerol kinase